MTLGEHNSGFDRSQDANFKILMFSVKSDLLVLQ
jgi:hypothetical protein